MSKKESTVAVGTDMVLGACSMDEDKQFPMSKKSPISTVSTKLAWAAAMTRSS